MNNDKICIGDLMGLIALQGNLRAQTRIYAFLLFCSLDLEIFVCCFNNSQFASLYFDMTKIHHKEFHDNVHKLSLQQ